MSGSIAMSALACLRTGSGLVSVAVPDRCLESVAAIHPALMTIPLADDNDGCFAPESALDLDLTKWKTTINAIGLGPGMRTTAGSVRLVERCLNSRNVSIVFDADAINVLALLNWPDCGNKQSNASVGSMVLTPHPGELHRLLGVPASDRDGQIDAAQALSLQTGAVCVVKGGPTVVVFGDEKYVNSTGNPGMATAGSGDVLTGIITSLLGQRFSPWDAARLGVWLHGLAGDLAAANYGHSGMTAMEIIQFLPQALSLAESE